MENDLSSELRNLKNALSIINREISGNIPFEVEKINDGKETTVPYAIINVNGDRHQIWMAENKVWANNFPIHNVDDGKIKGYLGFPTEFAREIVNNYPKEKSFDNLGFGGNIGNMGLNEVRKIVSEELSKIVGEDYDYAAEERNYVDNQYLESEEAVISSALSFMQDIQGSANKLKEQQDLTSTTPEVDGHIKEAISHINQARKSYFENLSLDIKNKVIARMGEVKID